MKRYDNKTVLVTGGNSGIGLATAQQFAREGARVIITGRDQATLDSAKELIGGQTLALRSDQGSIADGEALAATLAGKGLTLDAIFINAGVAKFAPFADITETTWDATFDANIKGPYFLIQALAPLLKRGAAIVLNGSINARIGMPGLVGLRRQQGCPHFFGQNPVGRIAAAGRARQRGQPRSRDHPTVRPSRHASGATGGNGGIHPGADSFAALRYLR